MNQSVTIEIINEGAMTLLQDMERLHLIRLSKKTASKKVNFAKKYRGAMAKQDIGEVDKQLDDLRNAWE